MQPRLAAAGCLFIRGITGDGTKTAELWEEFARQFALAPFAKAEENYYEVRFYRGDQPLPGGKDVHVGVLTAAELPPAQFTTLVIPASEYAQWDVAVAKGYDSENASIEGWLATNATVFGQRTLAGASYILECYNEKFKGGNQPDSLVELWLPVFRYCQSGMMPMLTDEDFGTNADGSKNWDYCRYCYQNGAFLDSRTMEETIEFCLPFVSKGNPYANAEQARRGMAKTYPRLKRWAK